VVLKEVRKTQGVAIFSNSIRCEILHTHRRKRNLSEFGSYSGLNTKSTLMKRKPGDKQGNIKEYQPLHIFLLVPHTSVSAQYVINLAFYRAFCFDQLPSSDQEIRG
jgi:hypothetical protein